MIHNTTFIQLEANMTLPMTQEVIDLLATLQKYCKAITHAEYYYSYTGGDMTRFFYPTEKTSHIETKTVLLYTLADAGEYLFDSRDKADAAREVYDNERAKSV